MLNSDYRGIVPLLHSTLKHASTQCLDNSQQADRIAQISYQLDRGEMQQKLEKLDLSAVATSLMRSGWTHQRANLAIAHYLYFLFLSYLHPSQILIPSHEVDFVWHEHILQDTRKYACDCKMLFNGSIHHAQKNQLWDNAVEENAQVAYRQTRSLYNFYSQDISPHESFFRKAFQKEEKGSACGHPTSE